jgi:hypothetical protein
MWQNLSISGNDFKGLLLFISDHAIRTLLQLYPSHGMLFEDNRDSDQLTQAHLSAHIARIPEHTLANMHMFVFSVFFADFFPYNT